MLRAIRAFFRNVHAQDLVEYSLLLAFIALVGIGIVLGASGSIQGIWSNANTSLVAANTAAGGQTSSSSDGNPGGGGQGDGGGHGDGGHGDGGHGDGGHGQGR